jgi:hypothetical protein
MPSSMERMVAYHLARLNDKNPEIRIKSIEELVLLEATQALDALEAVFRTDPDQNVRTVAQKAGRVLWMLKAAEKKNEDDSQPS